nr:MAG TPA: hypothetical protein [Caudoviricetes sp.]
MSNPRPKRHSYHFLRIQSILKFPITYKLTKSVKGIL